MGIIRPLNQVEGIRKTGKSKPWDEVIGRKNEDGIKRKPNKTPLTIHWAP